MPFINLSKKIRQSEGFINSSQLKQCVRITTTELLNSIDRSKLIRDSVLLHLIDTFPFLFSDGEIVVT